MVLPKTTAWRSAREYLRCLAIVNIRRQTEGTAAVDAGLKPRALRLARSRRAGSRGYPNRRAITHDKSTLASHTSAGVVTRVILDRINSSKCDVVWSTRAQRGVMRLIGLKSNDARRWQYQLWIFDKTRDQRYPVDGGVFDVRRRVNDHAKMRREN